MGSPWRLMVPASLAVLAAGFVALLVYCLTEAAGYPGFSLVDAYWRGRLPWMGIIEGLVVGGATATLLAGALSVLVSGGWIRRLALLPLLAPAGWWWFAAMVGVGINYAPCFDCPPRTPDPWAYAYSVPETALLFLILPALGVAALALILPPVPSDTSE